MRRQFVQLIRVGEGADYPRVRVWRRAQTSRSQGGVVPRLVVIRPAAGEVMVPKRQMATWLIFLAVPVDGNWR